METNLKPCLEWDVKATPLQTSEYALPQRTALLRNDDNSLLGIVSPQYNLLSNETFMQLNELTEKTGRFEVAGYLEFCNGKKVMSFLREKTTVKVTGYEASSHLVIGNSHDGSRQLYVGVANEIMRCENQFYHTAGILKLKHSIRIIPSSNIVDDIIKSYDQGNFSLNTTLERFRHVPLHENTPADLITEIYKHMRYDSTLDSQSSVLEKPLAKKIISSINSEVEALGNNLFGLFNGITYYTSHNQAALRSGFYGVSGSAARINRIAFDYCKSLVK